MKHSDHHNTSPLHPLWLAWILPVLLIIPNVMLAVTEQTSALSKATDVVLPLGAYMLLASASRRIGAITLWSLPLMILAAFQIVLLYLYGESIIAIDMFINVATTNVGEVSELLGNLTPAIVAVVVIYLPALVWAIALCARGSHTPRPAMLRQRRCGALTTAAGAVMLVCCYVAVDGFAMHREIFPVNVIYNACAAVGRTVDTAHYHETAASFDPQCSSTRPDSLREVYVMVVGETSRADNWQINGYRRPTNSRLSRRSGLVSYRRALSESNTTHKSVPMLMSDLDASTFGRDVLSTRGVLSEFADAGYATAFFSNQQRNHSFIDFFGEEADTCVFLKDDGLNHHDMELVDRVAEFVRSARNPKVMIVIHTYGSHFNYRERYTDSYDRFRPSEAAEADRNNRAQLLNAYDNTIVYADAVLDSIASTLASLDCHAGMVYASDHGEDIFDDSRERFLHASPTPTYYQLHVPMLVWMSPRMIESMPELYRNAAGNSSRNVSTSRSLYNTIIHMAGLSTPHSDSTATVTSGSYREPERLYLNDYNEGVKLDRAGLREPDLKMLRKSGISIDR